MNNTDPLSALNDASDEAFKISFLDSSDRVEWDRYVEHHPNGSFFQLYGWGKTICSTYGYEPLYLAAYRGKKIVGLLLLIDVRSSLLGRALISTAFTIGGGPIGEEPKIVEALSNAAAEEGETRGVQYVEFRNGVSCPAEWETKTGKYVNFGIRIAADETDNLNAIQKRRRAKLRKAIAAEKAGDFQVRVEKNLDEFYELYAKSMKALGTPIFPKRFIHELNKNFDSRTEISFVDYRGETVVALLSFYFKDRVLPYYIGVSSLAREIRAADYICWAQMRRAAARGIVFFDFGRSKTGSGSYAYKKYWGAEPEPITYQYKLIRARSIPDINPNNPKFKLFSKAWTHLPLPVANVIGPLLAPNFP